MLVILLWLCQGWIWAGIEQLPDGFITPGRAAEGAKLAQGLCATCHVFPAPDVLDRDTWFEGPLPWMMSVVGLTPQDLPGGEEGESIRESGSVLCTPALKKEEFGKIIAYYLANAPEHMAPTEREPVPVTLKQFQAHPLPLRSREPAALLVSIDERHRTIRFGNAASRSLEVLTADGTNVASAFVGDAPVSLSELDDGLLLTCIGSFSPSEMPKGEVVFLERQGKGYAVPKPLLSKLVRPVHTSVADLNGDGREDLVVCMFGWYSGRLSWFEKLEQGGYAEHELLKKPGSLRTEIQDMDGDGDPDIVALTAQATERMSVFLNDGRGEFTETVVFQKHPAFGHCYFEMADMNQDGRPDLIVVNGDNGDYPSPPKPYHGVRIYLNGGTNGFTESWFFPLPGATKATARDFDGDGDLDLACIAYYCDYPHSPKEGFVYLENVGGLKFEPSTFAESDAGRWLTMDAGDLDGDGDPDIVLGAVRRGPGRNTYIPEELTREWLESGLTLMVLENQWNPVPREREGLGSPSTDAH